MIYPSLELPHLLLKLPLGPSAPSRRISAPGQLDSGSLGGSFSGPAGVSGGRGSGVRWVGPWALSNLELFELVSGSGKSKEFCAKNPQTKNSGSALGSSESSYFLSRVASVDHPSRQRVYPAERSTNAFASPIDSAKRSPGCFKSIGPRTQFVAARRYKG